MRRGCRQDQQKPDDPVTRLRERADTMATTAAAMKRIADAADPLYKTLDDGQKRRLAILTHMEAGRPRGWRHHDGSTATATAMTATGIVATTGDRRLRPRRRAGQGSGRRPERL